MATIYIDDHHLHRKPIKLIVDSNLGFAVAGKTI